MNKFLAILIIIAVIGFAIYIFASPSTWNSLGLGGLTLFQNPHSSSSPFYYLFSGNGYKFPVTEETSTAAQQPGQPPPASGQTISPADIPFGFKASQLSPSFHKVRITNAVAANTSGNGDDYQQITLNAQMYDNSNGSINVTGWVIKTNHGGYILPQAIAVYNTLAPLTQTNINLRNGQSVQIFSNTNSRGVNFQLNKCTGYLANFPYFTPSPPPACPMPARTDIYTFSGECQQYIMGLGQCEIPRTSAPIPQDDYACRSYLPKLTYEGCVDTHKKDGDFLGSEWWIWSGRRILDGLHDRVQLFDKKNLLVDEFVY